MTTGIKVGNLPQALPGEPVSVVGTQGTGDDKRAVQVSLPPAAQNPVATRRDMDSGTTNAAQVTPASIHPFIQESRIQSVINWQLKSSTSHTVTASAKAAITGVAAKTTENVLTATFSNFRTFEPYNNMRVFYDDASGTPSVPGDTLQFGMLFGTEGRAGQGSILSRGRIAVTFWQNFGGIIHKRGGAGTVPDPYRWERVQDDDPDILNYVYGAPQLHGWLLLTPQAVENFGAVRTNYALVSNGRDELIVIYLRPDTAGTYVVQVQPAEYRVPRATITGAQVVAALSTTTGDGRVDAQYVKNLAAGEEGNGVPNNNSVSTVKLQDGAVTDPKVATAALDLNKLNASGAVSGQVVRFVDGAWKASDDASAIAVGEGIVIERSIATGAVTSPKIADDAVTSSKIADNAVTEDRLNDNAVTQAKIADNSVGLAEIDPTGGTVNQVLAIDSGGNPAWTNPASVASVPDNSVTTGKLSAGAVTEAKMATDSVGTAQIKDGAVSTNQLDADAVTGAKVADSAISTNHINPSGSANQVLTMSADATTAQWRDPTAAANAIADGSITAAKLATGSVVAAKVGDGAVVEAKIAGAAVTRPKIAADAVDATKIADSAIGPEHINVVGQANGSVLTVLGSVASWQSNALADNAVTEHKLAAGSVINSKIANDAVTSNKVADSAIDTAHLAPDAVETAKIKDGNVTLAKLSGAGASANNILKRNAANTAWVAGPESTQLTGVTIVDTLSELNSASTNLPTGGQIRIGTSFADSANSLNYRRGETYRRTVSGWQNVSQVIDGSTLQDNSITSAHLQSDSVTTAKIADNAVGTAQVADDSITLSKMADGSVSGDQITADAVPVSKMSAEGGTNDYFIARDSGEVVWRRRVVADNLAGTPVAGTFLTLDTNLVPTWGSAYPAGNQNGQIIRFVGNVIRWATPPVWTDLGGAIASGYQSSNPNRIITGTINTGLDFINYEEVEIVGADLCWTMIVSGPTWNASSATAPIRIHDHAQVYKTGATTYALATSTDVTSANGSQYAITRLRGKTWGAVS